MRWVIIWIMRVYQKTLSFDHGLIGKIFPNTRLCMYTPTCSEYGIEAVRKYGTIKGLYLAFRRVIRCAPWSEGGYDPVP